MTSNTVIKDKNGNYESHGFNLAMLEAKLSGNHIKVMLAYINVGGFNPRDAVFLSRVDYERFGFVRQTLATLRTELIDAGWLVKSGQRSNADYEYYYVRVGGPVAKRSTPRRGTGHLLSEKAAPPVVYSDTELTTELTTDSTTKNNKEQAPVADAPGLSQGTSLSLKEAREVDDSGSIDKDEVVVNDSPGALNETSHTAGGAAAGGTTDARRSEMTRLYRAYRPDLSDEELAELVDGALARQKQKELREANQERRQMARAARTNPADEW